jgi:hypothetical protein
LVETETHDYADRWWLEVDNGTESPSRIVAKATAYLSAYELAITGRRPFPKVLWVCTNAPRAHQLRRVLNRLPDTGRSLMAVCELDHLVRVVVAGPTAAHLHQGGTP